MFKSKLKVINTEVPFPSFTGEKVYMMKFFKKQGLPLELHRWQPTVDAMLTTVETDGPIFLMINQKTIQPGFSHRPSGVHIDGYWNEATNGHSGGRHVSGAKSGWQNASFEKDEGLILASDFEASRALVGDWSGSVNDRGSCEHIDLTNLKEVRLKASVAYTGNVTMLHESLPVPVSINRTLVRLNVPGWSI